MTQIERQSRPCMGRMARRRFLRGERGSLSVFSIFMFFIIIMVAGIGIDLMLNELRRIKLQAALDNAILAAADLDQTLPAQDVVEDYFAKVGYSDFLVGTEVDEGDNYRIVTAAAEQTTSTMIVHLLGVDELSAPAAGTAEERFTEIEISVVLDISGSMRNNSKMDNLKVAANEFIDLVLHPSMDGNVSVSLIPYSAHVNAGPELMSQFSVNHIHNYAHCMEFPDAEYSNPELNTAITYNQAQQYQWNQYSGNDYEEPICPQESYERITPISKNADYLKAQISALQPRGGTQIFLGMKWAVGLLDRSFNTVQQNMIAQGIADPDFADRPLIDTGDAVEKHIVLMTDGKNSKSSRLVSWAYDTQDEVEMWGTYGLFYTLFDVGYRGNNSGGAAPVPDPLDTRDSFDPGGDGGIYGIPGAITNCTPGPNGVAYGHCDGGVGGPGIGTLGAKLGTIWAHLEGTLAGTWTFPETTGGPAAFDHSFDGTVYSGYNWWSYYYDNYSAADGDALLDDICDAAKDEGIIVWTVGFEVDDHGADVMENCASSANHFFRVENTEISTAFRQIASQISQLRLTQ